jgi:hypothetical protein
MAEVRLTAMGRFTDYEVAVDLFARISSVAAAVDGAAVWEAFADRESGLFVVNETFTSEEAFLQYEDAVRSSGIWLSVGEVLEFERLIFFSPISDEETNRSLDAMGRITLGQVASK